jgi:hypothetical protein
MFDTGKKKTSTFIKLGLINKICSIIEEFLGQNIPGFITPSRDL